MRMPPPGPRTWPPRMWRPSMRLLVLAAVLAVASPAMVRTRCSPWASRMVGWAWMSRLSVLVQSVAAGSKPP